ncbi:MAG: MBL fold metallo-hydrolase, partial [Kiritimatiellaeota bacterium]|nr:MBL fold metallo-hydrolase [Kiritimatiellota bacterium]
MNIETLVVGTYEVNCYLLNGGGRAALVIDPGQEAGRIRERLRVKGWDVAAVLLTHGHADHLSGLGELLAAHPAPVYLHAQDARWAFSASNQLPPDYAGLSTPPASLQDVREGQELSGGGLTCLVLATPGHSP